MKIDSPELEDIFLTFQPIEERRQGGTMDDVLALALLDDPTYTRTVKMPKWNMRVDMLQEPKVAVKYAHAWGIPTSKSVHAQRADFYESLYDLMDKAYDDLVRRALDKYGQGGSPLISGIVSEHFPAGVKDRLRFLAHGKHVVKQAVRLHDYLSKTRSPLFK